MSAVKVFQLRRLTLSSGAWYASVVLGVPLVGFSVYQVVTTSSIDNAPAFATVAALIALLELLPLVQGRGHDPQGVVMSTSFSFAMLYLWGLWPAIVMVSMGSMLADVRAGKAWWKVLFNPCQYALSFAAAALVPLAFAPTRPTLGALMSGFRPSDLIWMAGSWVVYFLVNMVVVSAVLTFEDSFREVAFGDIVHETRMTLAVLALSPLIVVLAQQQWLLVPLVMIPLLMIYATAQQALEHEHAAGHDSLTGLPNRATLKYVVDDALAAHERGGPPFALMLIDLDDFKTVNDALGHHAGDELLREFATRVRAALRPDDVVARLGGDEFAVVAYDVDAFESCVVAQRMRDAMVAPVELEGIAIQVRFSVGIALCPQHGVDPATLMRRADVAMFRAKSTHTGTELYSSDQDENVATRLGLTGELRAALAAGELVLHYQPKVGRDLELIGMEALVRWPHAARGWVPPDEFIPLAERSGLMPLLTAHVLELAVAQMARWQDEGLSIPVAVNVSPTDLVGAGLVDVVEAALQAHGVPPSMLALEITERVLAHQLEESLATIDRLRGLGVVISLDDFGTGYSSLLRLGSLPVDEIKIDRAFVAGLGRDRRALGIVAALVGLAHTLEVPVIAEGVETDEQFQMLKSLGCDGLQGWHVGRPMAAELATTWVKLHVQRQRAARAASAGLATVSSIASHADVIALNPPTEIASGDDSRIALPGR